MRCMSFAATTEQIKNRTKTVTRRVGWDWAYPGMKILAVEKFRGVPLSKRKELGVIIVKGSVRVRLDTITKSDVRKEGLPEMSPKEFVTMFCKLNSLCKPRTMVTRIEFDYV